MSAFPLREQLAREAERYLVTVDAFAALGADPHAHVRAEAARARAREAKPLRSGSRRRRRLRH